jgi:YfiH family protein
MLLTSSDNLALLRFDLLCSCSGLVHGVSTRKGPSGDFPFDLAWSPEDDPGPMSIRLAAAARALNVDPELICCTQQVHGSHAMCLDESPAAHLDEPCRVCGEFDALITNKPGITLLIRVADCVPILLYDPVRRVVAVVHAGWKGTLANIVSATVERMCAHYGCRAADLLAGIGPSIGPCCFEVGADVAEQFRSAHGWSDCVRTDLKGFRIDLPGANRESLLRCGVLPHNVEMSGYCTACRLDIFFSHRGEQGNTGRFGLFAGLRA